MTITDRPLHNGLPVPWVAAWSGERDGAWDPNRQQSWKGILWLNNNRPGIGTPEFGMTNSYRQRECVRRGRCQVCGEKGATRWVIPNDEYRHGPLWEARLVINPPVHIACHEAAKSLCPHLAAVEPLAIIDDPPLIEYVACSATSADGRMTTIVLLDQAREEHWVGRELVVRLP